MFRNLFRRKSPPAAPLQLAADAAPPPAPAPPPPPPLSSAGLHVPRERLSKRNLHLHYAISSLMEELEAVDWYTQRADDTADPALKAILLHNAGEEIEHAAMALEWIRRAHPGFDKELREYLFTDKPITSLEARAMGREGH